MDDGNYHPFIKEVESAVIGRVEIGDGRIVTTNCIHCGWQGHVDDYVDHIDDCKGDTSMGGGQDKITLENGISIPFRSNSGENKVIDFIEDQDLDFHTGNVVMYICQAGKKTTSKFLQDLNKAKWYLDRYIRNLSEEEHGSISVSKSDKTGSD